MNEYPTILDAVIAANNVKGGTIHDFSRYYGVDLLKAEGPFMVRFSKKYCTDVICSVKGETVVIPGAPGKFPIGWSTYESVREKFNG